MFAYLKGIPTRLESGQISLEVHGVGYLVYTPLTTWEQLDESAETTIYTATYVREDRFDLYGFNSPSEKRLFELFIAQSGIGPKLGLELLSVPLQTFQMAVVQDDAIHLTNIKGIGKKTGEKLLVELRTMVESSPDLFGKPDASTPPSASFDQDAAAALANLGYDQRTIAEMLKGVPATATTTEERIAAALKTV